MLGIIIHMAISNGQENRLIPLIILTMGIACGIVASAEPPMDVQYPDWTFAGVPGGIPKAVKTIPARNFGAIPDDDKDDGPALTAAAADVVARTRFVKGSGPTVILLEAGTYHLDTIVQVAGSGVVFRGDGPDKTQIIVRYKPDGIRFFAPADGERAKGLLPIEVHFTPDAFRKLAIYFDDRSISEIELAADSIQRIESNMLRFNHRHVEPLDGVKPGRHMLKAIGELKKGGSVESARSVIVEATPANTPVATRSPIYIGAFTFMGAAESVAWLLAQDAVAGSRTLKLAPGHRLKKGDRFRLIAPRTPRWDKEVGNKCGWGAYRMAFLEAIEVKGEEITLNQPLRIDFPVVDGSHAVRMLPVEQCGVEDLSIRHEEKLWLSSVMFADAWNCWARKVHVKTTGRFPVYACNARGIEIRDCVFDDAWHKGGGGTGYVGFAFVSDCLMENVTTYRMRHAPLFEWAANGCVVRSSVFNESDAQFHSGWTHNNLIEQCVINSVFGNGGYGHGAWASHTGDKTHGPTGPRNVLHNNRITGEWDGIWLGGTGGNWIIQYNRIESRTGFGIRIVDPCKGHLIRKNVFVLHNSRRSAIYLDSPKTSGITVTDNLIFGGTNLIGAGAASDLIFDKNVKLPIEKAGDSQPHCPVPSLFLRQRDDRKNDAGN